MKNTFKLKIFFSVYKTNIDCFLFGAQFKIIGPRWCQNHDYARSEAEGIVMVLTSPRAYNCAPQSSEYLYTIFTPEKSLFRVCFESSFTRMISSRNTSDPRPPRTLLIYQLKFLTLHFARVLPSIRKKKKILKLNGHPAHLMKPSKIPFIIAIKNKTKQKLN